jgi:hypothetical protein
LMLSYDWDEDDDTPALLEITASATGDWKKNYNLKEGDYQEYSFRVWNPVTKQYSPWFSYRYTPLIIPFTTIGFIRDSQKYNPDKFEDMTDIATASMMVGVKSFLDMSFLSTINTVFDVIFDKYDTNKWDAFGKWMLSTGKSFVMPNLYTQTAKEIQAINGIGIKETTLRWNDPKSIMALFIQDIPYARNIYNDRLNGLGEIIVPKTNKFVSENLFFDREPNFLWKVIADNNMLNLRVPSIKTVKVPDPAMGNQEMPLTDNEYFLFTLVRGQAIKSMLYTAMDSKDEIKITPEIREIMRSKGIDKTERMTKVRERHLLSPTWMTNAQRRATQLAKEAVFQERLKKIK